MEKPVNNPEFCANCSKALLSTGDENSHPDFQSTNNMEGFANEIQVPILHTENLLKDNESSSSTTEATTNTNDRDGRKFIKIRETLSEIYNFHYLPTFNLNHLENNHFSQPDGNQKKKDTSQQQSQDIFLCTHCSQSLSNLYKCHLEFSLIRTSHSYLAQLIGELNKFVQNIIRLHSIRPQVNLRRLTRQEIKEATGLKSTRLKKIAKKLVMTENTESDDNLYGSDVERVSKLESETTLSDSDSSWEEETPLKSRKTSTSFPTGKNKFLKEIPASSPESEYKEKNEAFSSINKKRKSTSKKKEENSEWKPFKCTQSSCTKSFRKKWDMEIHTRSHFPEKPHNCQHCPLKFAVESYLRSHIRRKHPEEWKKIGMGKKGRKKSGAEHVCWVCGATHKLKSRLEVHMLYHKEERSFPCKECDKTFKTPRDLKRHEQIHQEKSFLCTLCGKAFAQAQGLRNHCLLHSGEKPYKCKFCDMAYTFNKPLKQHLMRVHGILDVENYAGTSKRQPKSQAFLSEGVNAIA